jgi:oxaloacetate decarboxylase alpha subunit
MAHIEIIDSTLRDGQQSLWGLRMRAYQAGPALPYLDETGFRVVDLTGAGIFQVLVREFRDDPWAHLDFLLAGLPNSAPRSSIRTITAVGFGFTPDAILDLFIQTLVKHGIQNFWIFDCLFDMPIMRRTAKVVHEAGADPVPTIMYGLTDLHTDEFFAARAREMAEWEGVKTIELEDAPGVLTPERAVTLLPALQEATPGVPLELHCHNTTGLAPLVYMEGLKADVDIFHTCSRTLANGPSLPSTEGMLEIIEALGHTHGLDESKLGPVAEHFARAADEAGYRIGVPSEYSIRTYAHQLPGGMMGTLRNQLSQHGMEHRLDEVLEETITVRGELGEPIMATPFSQFVGIQAVLNVVTGERYSIVPDEVIQYSLGHYGPLMRPVEPDVLDRVLNQPRAEHFATWERPQPTLAEIRRQFGKRISDEELLLRFMHSEEEVRDVLEGNHAPGDPMRKASNIVQSLSELIPEAGSLRHFSFSRPGFDVELSRSATGDGG